MAKSFKYTLARTVIVGLAAGELDVSFAGDYSLDYADVDTQAAQAAAPPQHSSQGLNAFLIDGASSSSNPKVRGLGKLKIAKNCDHALGEIKHCGKYFADCHEIFTMIDCLKTAAEMYASYEASNKGINRYLFYLRQEREFVQEFVGINRIIPCEVFHTDQKYDYTLDLDSLGGRYQKNARVVYTQELINDMDKQLEKIAADFELYARFYFLVFCKTQSRLDELEKKQILLFINDAKEMIKKAHYIIRGAIQRSRAKDTKANYKAIATAAAVVASVGHSLPLFGFMKAAASTYKCIAMVNSILTDEHENNSFALMAQSVQAMVGASRLFLQSEEYHLFEDILSADDWQNQSDPIKDYIERKYLTDEQIEETREAAQCFVKMLPGFRLRKSNHDKLHRAFWQVKTLFDEKAEESKNSSNKAIDTQVSIKLNRIKPTLADVYLSLQDDSLAANNIAACGSEKPVQAFVCECLNPVCIQKDRKAKYFSHGLNPFDDRIYLSEVEHEEYLTLGERWIDDNNHKKIGGYILNYSMTKESYTEYEAFVTEHQESLKGKEGEGEEEEGEEEKGPLFWF